MYLPKDENGQVVDGLKQFEKAVKRYGMKFGIYYATEGGGLQHFSTDVFVQNVEDLILRYDPAYLYFDGPQSMGGANYDVMYSMVRNYSDEIIINANVWGTEYGDPDLRTGECSGIYERARGSNLTKRTIMEPWKSLHTKNNYTPYYARRDDYRLVAQEMIANAGRGMVDNNDQMPIMSRGTNWDSRRMSLPAIRNPCRSLSTSVKDWRPGSHRREKPSVTSPPPEPCLFPGGFLLRLHR